MDQQTRNDRFRKAMTVLESEYSPFTIARWFCLGANERRSVLQMRSTLSRKTRQDTDPALRGSSYQDVLCAQLLTFMDSEGYDLGAIHFDENARLQKIPKRPLADSSRATSKMHEEGGE